MGALAGVFGVGRLVMYSSGQLCGRRTWQMRARLTYMTRRLQNFCSTKGSAGNERGDAVEQIGRGEVVGRRHQSNIGLYQEMRGVGGRVLLLNLKYGK